MELFKSKDLTVSMVRTAEGKKVKLVDEPHTVTGVTLTKAEAVQMCHAILDEMRKEPRD